MQFVVKMASNKRKYWKTKSREEIKKGKINQGQKNKSVIKDKI